MKQTIDPERLKRLRNSRGLTQGGLATRAKLNRQTVYRLENSQKPVRAGTVEGLGKALNVDVGVLTGEEPVPSETDRQPAAIAKEVSQVNTRVDAEIRNAFSLVALRYKTSVSRIVELAPFLFAVAAEASLRRRCEKLTELEAAFGRTSSLRPNFPHLPFWVADTYEQNEAISAEERSIARRDLFATTIPDDVFAAYDSPRDENYDENENNPFVSYLRELASQQVDVTIDSFGPADTSYRVGTAEALELTGGAEDLATGLLDGFLLIHEIPKNLLAKEAVSERVEWIRPKIEAARRAREEWLNADPLELLSRL